jgi:hypothetical protein
VCTSKRIVYLKDFLDESEGLRPELGGISSSPRPLEQGVAERLTCEPGAAARLGWKFGVIDLFCWAMGVTGRFDCWTGFDLFLLKLLLLALWADCGLLLLLFNNLFRI